MTFRTAALCLPALVLLALTAHAADKPAARVERLDGVQMKDVHVAPSITAADTCVVSDHQDLFYRIDGWVTGNELYKSYIDPERDCPSPYPFTITEINMPMIFGAAADLLISVDVEEVDDTTIPGCTVPGNVLSVSSDWELTIPDGGGTYNIWIALDTPVVVNGPFFAGFYLASAIDSSVGAALLADNVPVACRTFNIWDETIGWVDLVNNAYWNFPGHLAIDAAGVPGGHSSDTALIPQAALVAPVSGDVLNGSAEIWAWDKVASTAMDYMAFSVKVGASWSEFGRTYDGTRPLRDGLTPAEVGAGFIYNWNFSFLPEGTYWLKATAVDTSGRSASDSIQVVLEPTPPTPAITSPDDGGLFCDTFNILVSCGDENVSQVAFFRKALSKSLVSAGITALSQYNLGDVDGDPADGNPASLGEFGDYYSGPAAAAMALRVWYNRGYTALMQDGGSAMTVEEVAEELATLFETRENLGSFDEPVMAGLRTYAQVHGDLLDFDYLRHPNYYDLRAWAEDAEQIVILGLSGDPGMWVAFNGFFGWTQADSTWKVTLGDPIAGTVGLTQWRRQVGYEEVQISGVWHRVDIMIGMVPKDWTVTRTLIHTDNSGADGWSLIWPVSGMVDGDISYFRTIGQDASGYTGTDVIVAGRDCSSTFVAGDFDGDRDADVSDLYTLIAFIAEDGPPPSGGGQRADCNCDNVINVVDIVYYMNYLFGTSSPPCH